MYGRDCKEVQEVKGGIMLKFCYRKHACPALSESEIANVNVKIGLWHPRFLSVKIPGERFLSFKTRVVRIYFWLLSYGRFSVAYARSLDGQVVHTSYIVGSRLKFPFMGAADFEIGPCYTNVEFRGLGIYPAVLRYILTCKYGYGYFWMNVSQNNISSIRGIEKAGFERYGYSSKSRWLKIYKIIKQ